MNPQHKLNKLANRARRLQRVNVHKDLGNKPQPVEFTYHEVPTPLPKGNLLLISHNSEQVTRALAAIA